MTSAYVPVVIAHGVLTHNLQPEDVISLTAPEGTTVVNAYVRSYLAEDQPGAGIVYDNAAFVVSLYPTSASFRYLASSGDDVEAVLVYVGVGSS